MAGALPIRSDRCRVCDAEVLRCEAWELAPRDSGVNACGAAASGNSIPPSGGVGRSSYNTARTRRAPVICVLTTDERNAGRRHRLDRASSLAIDLPGWAFNSRTASNSRRRHGSLLGQIETGDVERLLLQDAILVMGFVPPDHSPLRQPRALCSRARFR